MFEKINKRIYRSLLLIAALFIFFMIVPTILIFTNMLYDTYENMARKKLDRSISSCRSFIDTVLNTAEGVALTPAVIDTVCGRSNDSLTVLLNDTCNYSLTINAITVYAVTGNVFASSGISSPPALAELQSNGGIAEFMSDADSSYYISLRKDAVARLYDNAVYDSSLGIVSCCCKIYDEGAVVGYVVADIFPKTMFGFFDYTDDSHFHGTIALVHYADGFLSSDSASPYNEELYRSYGETITTANNSRLIVPSLRNFYGATILIAVPLFPLYRTILIMALILVGLGLLLMIAVHGISRRNADGVTDKLENLVSRIQSGENRINRMQAKSDDDRKKNA